ncbi:MAG TPA: TIGR03087 family PEP-CTERM/XrtA system glycosyltransferase [Vicinamibacterales bacterium]|nr:TIGR03087 family PEP-CTERM/XrtA system glycosyltransferase [Vicinamibacterales bacterium]
MRILVLTHRLPYAPNRGDRLRAYHVIRHLREHAEVELFSLVHDDEEASHVMDVEAFVDRVTACRITAGRRAIKAAAAMLTGAPLTHALLDAPGVTAALRNICAIRPPDVVLAYCSGMARFAMHPPLAGIPMVLDFVDVDSGKWRELSESSRWPLSWIYRREAVTLGSFEGRAANRAATALVVNDREAAAARALAPAANVQVMTNGVETERLRPLGPPSARPRVVFCGVMNYAPNVDGITWFVQHVWPMVRAQRSDATLAIVGAHPTPEVRALSCDPSITVTGRVPDVRDWLWASAVGIAPLRVARGVQNKALEAIAAGLPIVITDAVAGGLPAEAAPASFVADAPAPFAAHVLNLLARSPDERRRIAQSADLSALSWSHTLESLWPILERSTKAPQRATGAVGTLGSARRWRSA